MDARKIRLEIPKIYNRHQRRMKKYGRRWHNACSFISISRMKPAMALTRKRQALLLLSGVSSGLMVVSSEFWLLSSLEPHLVPIGFN